MADESKSKSAKKKKDPSEDKPKKEDEKSKKADKPDSNEVVPYNFNNSDFTVLSDFNALHGIGDRFSRSLRFVIQNYIRSQPRITAFPPDLKSFQEYAQSTGNFMSLSVFNSTGLKGSILISLHSDLVNFIVHRYFGGAGICNTKEGKSEFTVTEERIIHLLVQKISNALETSWKEVSPLDLTFSGHETNPSFLFLCDMMDSVVVSSFSVQAPGTEGMTIDVVYPYLLFKPIMGALRSSSYVSSTSSFDAKWQGNLWDAVLDVELEVKPRLSETTIPFGKLVDIKEGSVIPLPQVKGVKVYIGGMCHMEGVLGAVGSNTAIEITKVMDNCYD